MPVLDRLREGVRGRRDLVYRKAMGLPLKAKVNGVNGNGVNGTNGVNGSH